MFRLELKSNQKLFFASDLHFNHVNLCKGTTRWRKKVNNDTEVVEVIPDNVRNFTTLDEMDSTVLNNINAVVGIDDILFILGDFSFNGFENIRKFRNRIICRNIYYICGNHDEPIIDNKDNIQEIFTKVWESGRMELEVVLPFIKGQSAKTRYEFVLDHYPICSWNKMSKGRMHLFGHVHLPEHQKIMPGKAMDVGVDGNNYKPYELKEVIALLKDRPNKPSHLPSDHHADEWVEIKK